MICSLTCETCICSMNLRYVFISRKHHHGEVSLAHCIRIWCFQIVDRKSGVTNIAGMCSPGLSPLVHLYTPHPVSCRASRRYLPYGQTPFSVTSLLASNSSSARPVACSRGDANCCKIGFQGPNLDMGFQSQDLSHKETRTFVPNQTYTARPTHQDRSSKR